MNVSPFKCHIVSGASTANPGQGQRLQSCIFIIMAFFSHWRPRLSCGLKSSFSFYFLNYIAWGNTGKPVRHALRQFGEKIYIMKLEGKSGSEVGRKIAFPGKV